MTELLATVFVASLLGSVHCLGMCGGFVAFYSTSQGVQSPDPRAHAAYNLGRLVTYLGLGAIAGTLGAAINLAGESSGARQLAALVSGVVILTWGLALLIQASGAEWAKLGAPRWLEERLSRVLPHLMSKPPIVRASALGLASTLLPCGWLYGFAVTAAGTGSASAGAAVMGAFWLGTVPAMLSAGLSMQKLTRLIGPRLGTVMAAMFLVMGMLTIMQRGPWSSPVHAASSAPEPPHACH